MRLVIPRIERVLKFLLFGVRKIRVDVNVDQSRDVERIHVAATLVGIALINTDVLQTAAVLVFLAAGGRNETKYEKQGLSDMNSTEPHLNYSL